MTGLKTGGYRPAERLAFSRYFFVWGCVARIENRRESLDQITRKAMDMPVASELSGFSRISESLPVQPLPLS
jgi:hypothetical protein